jgi:predicted O-methyltransferase YrrM
LPPTTPQVTSQASSEATWNAVDEYYAQLFVHADAALDATLKSSDAAGLPAINVSAPAGKLLHVLARAVGARRILELGTLAGYSAIWMARALPADGKLITLEFDPKHADVAKANFERAGVASKVEVRLGAALDTLPKLVAEGAGPFDLIFIDADKQNYPHYFTWALKLSRPGTLILADNVVRKGAVADANTTDTNVQGIRRMNELIAAEPRVTATAMQTVGAKGYDGLAFALVLA